MEPELTDLRRQEWRIDWSIGDTHIPRGLMEKYGFLDIVLEQDRGYDSCIQRLNRECRCDGLLKLSSAEPSRRVYTVDIKSANAMANIDFLAESLPYFLGGTSTVSAIDGNLLLCVEDSDDGLMFGPVIPLLLQVLDSLSETMPLGKPSRIDAGNKINAWHIRPNLDEYTVTITDNRHFNYRLELDRWVMQATSAALSFSAMLRQLAANPLAREADRAEALINEPLLIQRCECVRDTWRARFLSHF